MAVADRHGLPVAVYVESATPHDVKLATSTLAQMIVPDAPQVELFAKRDAIELFLQGAMEALADAIGLRRLGFRAGVVDVLYCQIELILAKVFAGIAVHPVSKK
jgi:hypothetical protein